MAVDVIMPQMGESIFEGTITKWLKKPGDRIERDEPLFEISTDKVDAEIPSPAAGVLQRDQGRRRADRADSDGRRGDRRRGAAAAQRAAPRETARLQPDSAGRRLDDRRDSPRNDSCRAGASHVQAADAAATIHSSPLVRRLARENNIDLATVRGTGAGGRISKQDILAAIAAARQQRARGSSDRRRRRSRPRRVALRRRVRDRRCRASASISAITKCSP